jgi:hypothetical protein
MSDDDFHDDPDAGVEPLADEDEDAGVQPLNTEDEDLTVADLEDEREDEEAYGEEGPRLSS